MFLKYNEIRKARLAGERGFTLVELLVVIVIIGILVAIAIPVFLSQRQGAQEKSIESDVRNAVLVMETAYADNSTYTGAGQFAGGSSGGAFDLSVPATPLATGSTVKNKLTVSPDVTLTIAVGTDGRSYTIVGKHSAISTTYTYDSTLGTTVKGPVVTP